MTDGRIDAPPHHATRARQQFITGNRPTVEGPSGLLRDARIGTCGGGGH